MVAACTAWADWKHRRATKTACDTPVPPRPPPPPPPPVCTVTRVLWGKRGGWVLFQCVCLHSSGVGEKTDVCFHYRSEDLPKSTTCPQKIAPEERCTRFLNACRGCSRLPPGRPLALPLALPLPLARGRRSLKQLALNLGF